MKGIRLTIILVSILSTKFSTAQKILWLENRHIAKRIKYVVGDEWHAGNLSYHISTRPIWYETIKGKTHELDPDGGIIYTGNADILKEICPGDFGKIKKQGFCMIGVKNR